jgi:hypothetical protein
MECRLESDAANGICGALARPLHFEVSANTLIGHLPPLSPVTISPGLARQHQTDEPRVLAWFTGRNGALPNSAALHPNG